ncbi:MAG: hypothetical protein K9K66_09995 [Desulfarculaceae bacterium]|nr:hypothetical protein [Desulfarculaceae bacterium]MCF8073740.1 hypothetical protein [Desulfarculaceae bacterium]MCF8101981.1 hypothetical protein [Desulfarculaceae bacterium]MCF8115951.1 hypothetical protein [Desulfarculaceae bacterium]
MINTRSINTILALSLAAMVLFSLPLLWHERQPIGQLIATTQAQASAQR